MEKWISEEEPGIRMCATGARQAAGCFREEFVGEYLIDAPDYIPAGCSEKFYPNGFLIRDGVRFDIASQEFTWREE